MSTFFKNCIGSLSLYPLLYSVTSKSWRIVHIRLIENPRPPGETFLKPFLKPKKTIFPVYVKSLFLLESLKLPPDALLELIFTKKLLGEDPQTPTWWREIPATPSTHATLGRIVARRFTSCHFVSHKKFSVKKMLQDDTNLWLKPWLHVTNPDHKEYLWVCRHISKSWDWKTFF